VHVERERERVTERVILMTLNIGIYRVLVEKPEGKRTPGRPSRR